MMSLDMSCNVSPAGCDFGLVWDAQCTISAAVEACDMCPRIQISMWE
jgi:hypothetical protein